MHESGRIARLVAKLDIRIGSEWNLLPEFAESLLKFSDRWPAVNIFFTCSPKLLGTWFSCLIRTKKCKIITALCFVTSAMIIVAT